MIRKANARRPMILRTNRFISNMATSAAEKEKVLAALAELSQGDPEDPRLDVIQLDGLVALKIIKHAKDNLPYLVTGQLLGLDFGTTLEVTNCFPFPSNSAADADEATAEANSVEYQWEMMKCLREVNIDNNTVGWYQSAYLGSFLNDDADFIATQYSYQTTIPKCVALIYDPLRTKQGALSLKAYRLTANFMELYKGGVQSFTQDAITKAGLSFNDIVEEIPITIHNSMHVNALLHELEESRNVSSLDFERLDLTTNPFLERNLDNLLENIDELVAEQNKYQYYQRQMQRHESQKAHWAKKKKSDEPGKADSASAEKDDPSSFKPPQNPPRLEALLSTQQISNYCQQINQFAGQGLGKLYAFRALEQ